MVMQHRRRRDIKSADALPTVFEQLVLKRRTCCAAVSQLNANGVGPQTFERDQNEHQTRSSLPTTCARVQPLLNMAGSQPCRAALGDRQTRAGAGQLRQGPVDIGMEAVTRELGAAGSPQTDRVITMSAAFSSFERRAVRLTGSRTDAVMAEACRAANRAISRRKQR